MDELANMIRPVAFADGELILLDQTKLPGTVEYVQLRTVEEVWSAIRSLQVRGAPAIGITAAYGFYLGAIEAESDDVAGLLEHLAVVKDRLASSRPTAVNLFWALSRMWQCATRHSDGSDLREVRQALLMEAQAIQQEDEEHSRRIGKHLVTLFYNGMGILTHCNTGSLATSRYGTALAGFYVAHEQGMDIHVYADETRPILQGARLTAWELLQAGIDVTLICDNMAASVMAQGKVQAVVVGADRIAANGDVANKIGTQGLAVLAKHFGIPFYVAAPRSTIDLDTPDGSCIPIEERSEQEVVGIFGTRIAPDGVKVYNPAFDVTDHELITAIVTEDGIIRPPFKEGLPR